MRVAFGAYLAMLVGFILAAGITVLVAFLLEKPLRRFLTHLLGDEVVARTGTIFVLIVLGLHGLSVVVSYIPGARAREFLTKLTSLGLRLAEEVQWVAWIAALLFIGYAIRQRFGSDE